MIKRILALIFIASSALAQVPGTTQTKLVRPILLDDLNANGKKIINADLSNIILPASQITGTISGGGGGTGVNSLVLAAPSPLLNNVTFSIGSLGDISGALTLQAAPAHTFFGNVSSSASNPNYMTVNDVKNMIAVNNVDNTSDLNKPVSTAMQAALDAGLAAKQNSLGVPSTNGYLVTANTDGSTSFVDPASVGPAFGAAPANTFFGNGTGSAVQPAFMSVNTAKSSLGINNVENTAISTWPGSANVTTLGTVTTGVWNGTAIGASFLPTLNSITAPTADVSLNAHKVTNLSDPSNALDATNKQYVDSVANAGPPHAVVATASTANLTLSGEQTVDGVLTSTSRVLVKNQTTAADNGIYVTAAGAWARATDADTGLEVSGVVFVSGGTVNAGSTWGVTTPQPITLGSTSIAYTLTGQGSTYTAGSGINLSGSQFSLASMAANSIKGNNTGSSASPIDLSASQTKSLLALNLVENTALSTWAGSGNITTLGTVTAGTVPIARLGGVTTVGASLLAIPDPNALRYIRIKTDNTIEVLTNTAFVSGVGAEPAFGNPSINGQVISSTTAGTRSFVSKENPLAFTGPLSRIGDTISIPQASSSASGFLSSTDWTLFNGKETGLTFSAPLSRSVNTISMTQASGSSSGYLIPTDWNVFNNKVPSTRSLVGTPPITIGGTTSGDLTQDRAIGITQASNSTSGYITAGDYLKLPSNVTGIRLGAGVGSSDTAAAANFDYRKDTFQAGTNTALLWGAGVTNFIETQNLTASPTRTLPATSGFVDGSTIKYTDSVTTGLFGPRFLPAGSDTLKGFNAVTWNTGYVPFVGAAIGGGSKTITFQKKGANWEVYAMGGDNQSIYAIQSNINAAGRATFDPSALSGSRRINVPDQDSSLYAPSSGAGVITDANSDGTFTKAQLHPTDLIPQEDVVGTAGVDITETVHTVSFPGSTDTVRIVGNVVNPLTIRWPNANQYSASETVWLIDASGTVSTMHPVSVTSTNGTDTFNAANSFIFDESNGGRKALTSDQSGNWSVSLVKTSIQPYKIIAPVGNVFTINADPNAVKQNAQLNLVSGANNLLVNNPADGMSLELVLVQPASGSAATLNLPIGSSVSGGGGGTVSLTATNGAIDKIVGTYNGNLNAFLFDVPRLNYTTATLPSAPTGLATSGITASKVDLTWTDVATNETGYDVQRANGTSGTSFSTIATLDANSSSFTDNGVASGTGYNYKVRAFNSAGYSAFSGAANATTTSGGPTADLWEVHFNEGAGTSANATVGPNATLTYANWTSSTQASAFAFNPVTGMVNPFGQSISVQGTAGTSTYSYRIAAFKTSGKHSSGSLVSTTTGNATLTGANFNRISWSAVSGADYYIVYRITVPSGSGFALGALTGTGSTFTATTFDDTGVGVTGGVPGDVTVNTDAHTATASSNITYGSNKLSVSFWAKTNFQSNDGSSANIIDGGANWTIKTNGLSSAGNPKLVVSFNGSTGTVTGTIPLHVSSNGSFVDSGTTWHHIVVELDNSNATNTGTEIKVYYDGSSTAQTTTYTVTTRSGALSFPAGATKINAGTLAMAIDDVRIYGRLLTATPTTGEIPLLFAGNAQ